MKQIFILCILLAYLQRADAQKVSGIIRGTLHDSALATPLADATVSVVRLSDSSLISFSLTDNMGRFEIKNLEAGTYYVVSSFSGLQTFKKNFVISAANPIAEMGLIKMERFYKTLEGVVITEAPVRINGDTISYRADAFKTKPNATVEDLLKKLPGVLVERDGTVKAQGENVQKVYVDGKEFFNSDPKLATKNLTAEMVDQVEVFDDMSEQAKFSRIDDGSRTKAINLKLKKDKKKGVFGKAYAGAGRPGDRFDMGLNANVFKGAMQTYVFAKNNNTNNIGFSVSDIVGTMGVGALSSGGMGGGGMNITRGGGGGNPGSFSSGNNNGGITKSSNIGINYRDTWSKFFEVNGSYSFNHVNTGNERTSNSKNFYTDSTRLQDAFSNSRRENDNHRINMNLVYSIDSFNSIIYNPNINYQKTFNTFSRDSLNIGFEKEAGGRYMANKILSLTNTNGDGYNWSNNLIWRRKFRRPGRTLSLNLSGTLGATDRNVLSEYDGEFFNAAGIKWRDSTANVLNINESETKNYGVSLSYTEPIARDKILEFNYSHNSNHSLSEREVLGYDAVTGKHNIPNAKLSNNFENENISDRAGTNLRIVKKKYNYQLGFSMQQTVLNSNNLTTKKLLNQKFTNYFPTASFNYQFARSRSLRFNYRGSTRQPSVTQLQEVPDVTSPPNIYIGNPALGQEFSNNFTLSYNFFDLIKFRNLFALVTFNNTMDKITNSIKQLPTGGQQTRPINLDGAYNVAGTFNIGFPIKKMQGGNFNTNTRIAYGREVSLINDVENFTKNLTVGEDLRLSYNYKEKLDMGIGVSSNYTRVRYTNTDYARNNQNYFTHALSADVTYTLPKGFILSTDFDYTLYTGRTDGFNQNFALWNGGLAKELFKNKRGEIKFSVYDILNQNIGITRNASDNYVEDVRNSVLNRFFMLTFTYKLTRMGGRAMPAIMERATRGIRITQ